MNKSELVTAMMERCRPDDFKTRAAAERAADAMFGAMHDALVAEGKVVVSGFGSFNVKKQAARVGRNVQTQEKIEIPAHNAVKFSAGKALREAVR